MNVEQWYSKGEILTINNLKVFYVQEGTGPFLFCIHGFPTASWDFDPIWEPLINNFKVIASDLIGLGRSAKPKQAIPVTLQADIIEALLVELGVQEAHMLAHDLGDTVGQELLARQLEGKSKIKWLSAVLLNGGLFPETHHARPIQKLLISPFGNLAIRLFSESTYRKNMTNVFGKDYPPSDEFLTATWGLIQEQDGLKMLPRLIRYMAERRQNRERWLQPLQKNIVPLLLINGTQDPVSGGHMAARYKELVPNANVVHLDDAGHYPHVETPEPVAKAFLEFHKTL